MMKISFTIDEDEVREVALCENITEQKLTKEQVKSILHFVEVDEWLWKNITTSIAGAIEEVISIRVLPKRKR